MEEHYVLSFMWIKTSRTDFALSCLQFVLRLHYSDLIGFPGWELTDRPLRASSDITVASKLARLPSSGTVPVSGLTAAVERAHSDRARSAGAKGRHWYRSVLFIVGALRARRTVCLLPREPAMGSLLDLTP